jgi:hypothetical protein
MSTTAAIQLHPLLPSQDRRRTPMPGKSLDDLVGAERAVAVQQRLEHVAAHRGEPLAIWAILRLAILRIV